MDEDKILELGNPDSGCKLARTMSYTTFHGRCMRTKDICEGCCFNPCQRIKAMEDLRRRKIRDKLGKHNFETNIEDSKRQKSKAKVDKHTFETNKEIAERLGVSKRQVTKMRKRGEL